MARLHLYRPIKISSVPWNLIHHICPKQTIYFTQSTHRPSVLDSIHMYSSCFFSFFNFVIVTISFNQENQRHTVARVYCKIQKIVAHLHGLPLLCNAHIQCVYKLVNHFCSFSYLFYCYFTVWPVVVVLHFGCFSTVTFVCVCVSPSLSALGSFAFICLTLFGPVSESRLFTFRSSFLSLFFLKTNNDKHFSILDPLWPPPDPLALRRLILPARREQQQFGGCWFYFLLFSYAELQMDFAIILHSNWIVVRELNI